MRGLIFDGALRLVENLPQPLAGPDEALIAVHLAGICNTDLEILRGYAGFRGVLGHEFVGRVDHAAESSLIGARVCGEINISCGCCTWCVRGLGRHCPRRTVLGIRERDGAFAEHLVLPVTNLVRVPDSVPDEEAVFTEPLAAALEIMEQVHVPPGIPCAVVGDGKLGALCAQVLALHGSIVTVVGRHEEKLAVLARMGMRGCLEPPSEQFALVVEATGSPSGFSTALNLVEPRGTLVLKSTFNERPPIDLAPVVVREIRLIGSRCGPFAPALALLARGAIDVRSLIDATYPLTQGLEAMAHAARRGARKILLRMDQPE